MIDNNCENSFQIMPLDYTRSMKVSKVVYIEKKEDSKRKRKQKMLFFKFIFTTNSMAVGTIFN